MNTTILPHAPVTATRFKLCRDVPPPAFDVDAFSVTWRYIDYPATTQRVPDGDVFLMDRRLIVVPRTQEIIVELFDGATVATLVAADLELRIIRDGMFACFPWREKASEAHPGASFFSVLLGTPVDTSGERIIPCRTTGCDENGRHHADDMGDGVPIHRQVIANGNGYRIDMFLDATASPAWETYVAAGELTPETASALAHDLQWAAAEAAKLNASLTPALAGVAS